LPFPSIISLSAYLTWVIKRMLWLQFRRQLKCTENLQQTDQEHSIQILPHPSIISHTAYLIWVVKRML
jgi:hypothetical protein